MSTETERKGWMGLLAMQGTEAERIRSMILDPLSEAETARQTARAARAAATKVDFFTLVRGED